MILQGLQHFPDDCEVFLLVDAIVMEDIICEETKYGNNPGRPEDGRPGKNGRLTGYINDKILSV